MTVEEKKAATNRKRAASMKLAWATGKGTLGGRARRERLPCKCGCGRMVTMGRLYAKGCYDPGAAHRGRKQSKEWIAKKVVGMVAAHARGAFSDGFKQRRERTLSKRPLCLCGCGRPVGRADAKYAKGCFDATTPENFAKVSAARDMKKLGADTAVRTSALMKVWKASGQLEVIRRKARLARGMSDHLWAKAWVIRDPCGKIFKFSNLLEWARQNEWRFEDTRPDAKLPFALRIAGGIGELLSSKGRSTSYFGWTAVSKLELEAGGEDLLGRDSCADAVQVPPTQTP